MPALPGRLRAIKRARAAEMPQTGPKEGTIYVNTEAGRRALKKAGPLSGAPSFWLSPMVIPPFSHS